MRRYETLYIVNPNLTDEDYKQVVHKVSNIVEKEKGVIIKVQEWGKQKLAYRVKKADRGSYVLLDFCGDPGITKELERELNLDDRVLKYQTVKLADKADPQQLIQKEEEAKKEVKEAAQGNEAVVEVSHEQEPIPQEEVRDEH